MTILSVLLFFGLAEREHEDAQEQLAGDLQRHRRHVEAFIQENSISKADALRSLQHGSPIENTLEEYQKQKEWNEEARGFMDSFLIIGTSIEAQRNIRQACIRHKRYEIGIACVGTIQSGSGDLLYSSICPGGASGCYLYIR